MLKSIKKLFFEKSQWSQFNKQNKYDKELVFYAESKNDWLFMGPLLQKLPKATLIKLATSLQIIMTHYLINLRIF